MTASRTPLLEVRGLSKAFGGLRAVDDLSFTVGEGEIMGLLGPNGSGKTTVFNLIAGTCPPDRGHIYFSLRQITRCSPSARVALGIARTFQLVRALPNLSALDNVLVACLYGHARAPSVPRARPEARRFLDLVGLGGKGGYSAARLTLAERKRLEVARALATRPRLLMLDEPAAGLNPVEVNEVLSLCGQIRAAGITLIVVEHNVHVARALCDRVVILSSGKMIADGPPARALERPQVVEVYLGRT